MGVLLLAGLLFPTSPAFAVDGGRAVQEADAYPYVGMLTVPRTDSDTLYELCTAVLVSPTWVLTARHCLGRYGYNTARAPISVKLGKISSSDVGVIQRDARELVFGVDFDLALLRVDPITEIQPVELVNQDEEELYKNGTVATAIGWGGNRENTLEYPGTLNEGTQEVEDQIYSLAQLFSGYNYLMKTTPSNGDGKVQDGDSGGPLIVETSGSGPARRVLIGIVSQGDDSGGGVYTKVGSTYAWITQTMGR
ncbi:MAG: S1 family peptidase [Pseudonocardia sp.]